MTKVCSPQTYNHLFAGFSLAQHETMLSFLDAEYAESTQRNHYRQAKRYLEFMLRQHLDPAMPDERDVMYFAAELFAEMAPASAKNILSGARTWVAGLNGRVEAFDHPNVMSIKRGAVRTSSHQVAQAPPLTPEMIAGIADYLDQAGPSGVVPKAALLLGFFSMLRASNLLSLDLTKAAGPHTLRRQDVKTMPDGLEIVISSSKTIVSAAAAVTIFVPRISSNVCPVKAYLASTALVPAHAVSPLFVLPSGLPLTPRPLTAVLRAALLATKIPHPASYSLHSLRRGASYACSNLAVPLASIMAHGTWTSNAVSAYLPKKPDRTAPAALGKLFGPQQRVHHPRFPE